MLRTLLQLAAGLDTSQTAALAHTLGISFGQVRQMLEHLERLGYLEEVVPGCAQPCERCPLRSACLFRRQPRVWMLTHKGKRLLAFGEQAAR